jgi:hypothetical protein
MTSRSYLTCQNEFKDTFPGSPVPNKSTISRLMNRLRHCRNSSPGCIKHEEKSECMRRWTRWTFPKCNIKLFFVFWFQWNLFFTNRTCARNGLRDFSIILYKPRLRSHTKQLPKRFLESGQGFKSSVCSAASRCVILLLADNPFTFTHFFVASAELHVAAYTAIISLTYLFLNYCTKVLVQIYIDVSRCCSN